MTEYTAEITPDALRDPERRYRLLAEHARDMVWAMTPEGVFAYTSPASERILGWRPEERHGAHVNTVTLMTPASQQVALGHFQRAMAGEIDNARFEAEHLRSDGSSIWCEINATVLRDGEGAVHGIVGSTRDVSERRAALEALAASEARYRWISEGTADVVYVYDAEGYIRFVSPSIARVLGFEPDERIGMHFRETSLTPEAKQHASRFFEAARAGTIDNVTFEAVQATKDHRRLPCEISAQVHRDPAGNLDAVHVTVRDISGRRRIEEALNGSEARYRRLTEGSLDPIIVYGADHLLRYANPAAVATFGEPRERLVGSHVHFGMTKASRETADAILARFHSGDSDSAVVELEHVLRNGRHLHTEVRAWPQRDDDGQLESFQFIARDITARRREVAGLRAQRELLASRAARVREVNKELEAYTATVSHDLRAPLRRLRRMLTRAEAEATPDWASLHTEVSRVEDLVVELLELSKSVRTELAREPLDIARMVGRACSQAADELGEDRWFLEIDEDQSYATMASVSLVDAMVRNIVLNAFRYAGATPLRIRVSRNLDTFTVRDNGGGFADPDPEKYFQPFVRGGTQVGTGIGLTTARRIAERHGGRMWAENPPDGGAAIHFTLRAKSND